MNSFLVGTGVAMVTPFTHEGAVDYDGLTSLIEHCIKGQVEYVVALGTTAEVATLSKQEKQEVVKHIKQVIDGRIPIVLGVGGNNTQAICDEIQAWDLEGIAAVLSVVPYYNKPSQEGIFQHYKTIAEASPLPIIIYNVPGRTGVNMTANTTLRLAKVDNICAVKEATGDITQVLEILAGCPEGFIVLSGDDMLALPLVTAGGHGVISVIGQGLPQDFSDMVRLGLEGKNKEAYALHFKMMEATELAFIEGNPVGIKAILEAQNVCQKYVRLPLVPATDELVDRIGRCMSTY